MLVGKLNFSAALALLTLCLSLALLRDETTNGAARLSVASTPAGHTAQASLSTQHVHPRIVIEMTQSEAILLEGYTPLVALAGALLSAYMLLHWALRFPSRARLRDVCRQSAMIKSNKDWSRRVVPLPADDLGAIFGSSEVRAVAEALNALVNEVDVSKREFEAARQVAHEHISRLTEPIEKLSADSSNSRARRREMNMLALTIIAGVEECAKRASQQLYGLERTAPTEIQVAFLKELRAELYELRQMTQECKGNLDPYEPQSEAQLASRTS